MTRNYGTSATLGTDPTGNMQATTRRYADTAANTFLPVCNRSHFNGNGGSASTALIQTRGHSSRVLLKVISSGATQLQVEWANIYTTNTAGSSEINGPNPVTARFALEYPAGNPRQVSGSTAWSSSTAYALLDQVTVSGTHYVCIQANTNQAPASSPAYWTPVVRYAVRWDTDTDANGTVTFGAGAYLKSIPINLTNGPTLAGQALAVCSVFDSGASSGNYIPYGAYEGGQNKAPYVDWIINSGTAPVSGSDLCATGVTTQTNGTASTSGWTNAAASGQTITPAAFPTAITGNLPLKRCIALFGDSLVAGFGGDWRDGSMLGPAVRMVDGATWWRVAQGGNKAACYSPSLSAPWQASVLRRCTAVVTNQGINDISIGDTFAQVQAAKINEWKWLASCGIPVYQALLTPISSSSDTWATTANQGQFTNGGAIATTQYPGGSETYAASVYGQLQMWMSQQGGSLSAPDGTTLTAGQPGHPIEAVIDWAAQLRDPITGWKWNSGGVSLSVDGAHPNAYVMGIEALTLGDVSEALLMSRQQASSARPWNPQTVSQGTLAPFDRSAIATTAATDANTFLFSVLGISPGKYFSILRWFLSSAPTTTAGFWSILAGTDPAYLRCIASGSATYAAGINAAIPAALGSPLWIPPGQLVVGVLTKTASQATAFGCQAASAAALNVSSSGHILGGGTTGTAAALTVGSSYSVANGASWSAALAAVASRVWMELV